MKNIFYTFVTTIFVFCGFFVSVSRVFAIVSTTSATGGASISTDTVGGSYTTLTGPVLAESANAQIKSGTITLTTPMGFEFDSSNPATITIVGNATSTNNINNLSTGTTVTATTTASQITFIIYKQSSSSANTLTWSNIRVRPTAKTPLAIGNIILNSTGTTTGLVLPADVGVLTEVAGAEATLNSIAITTQPTKLSYVVGDTLDISGLVVTGTYSDATTKIETIAAGNVTGFDNSVVATNQVLTVTVGGKTTTYLINIIAPLSSNKNITSFTFTNLGSGVITGNNITVAVPFGTNVATLAPSIEITGVSVSPISGSTQDFTNPVTYTVTAENSSAKTYTVTVTVTSNPDITSVASDKEILTDNSIKGDNADLSHIITALVNPLPSSGSNGSTITWTSSATTTVSNNGQVLTRPVFGAGNATVTMTATVTKGLATDTKSFTLTVLESLSSAKAITAFSFSSGIGVIDETAHIISVNVPFGTNITALVATFTTTGASVSVGETTQTSGVTANNFTTSKTYRVTAANNTTQNYVVTVTVLASTQTAPSSNGTATSTASTPEVVITNPTQEVNVTIESGTTNPAIDVSAFITGGTGTLPEINITSANANNATVAIPASTVVTSASTTWDGVIAAPTITTVTLPDTSGVTKTLSTAIEIGFSGEKLSFNKAVRILLVGQAGKRAGYVRTGITFTEITSTCAADNQATGDVLVADGDCKIDIGSDLVIWTKHFTSFATYTQTTNSNSGGSSSGNGNGGGTVVGLLGVVNGSQTPNATLATAQVPVTGQAPSVSADVLTEREERIKDLNLQLQVLSAQLAELQAKEETRLITDSTTRPETVSSPATTTVVAPTKNNLTASVVLGTESLPTKTKSVWVWILSALAFMVIAGYVVHKLSRK